MNINRHKNNFFFLTNINYLSLLPINLFNLNIILNLKNKNYIFKKYFNIFFKYNFLIYKHNNFFKGNSYFFKKYTNLGNFKIILIYWSFYFNQLNNILNLFYYINYNNLNYYFLTTKLINNDIITLNWLKYKTKILHKFLNFFKINLYNLKKFNYVFLLKKFFKKYKIQYLIILDIDVSNFFFNFFSKLNINMINIFSLNINFLNCMNYSNFLVALNNIYFYKILLTNFFYDIYILAKFNKYFFFFKKYQHLISKIYIRGLL